MENNHYPFVNTPLPYSYNALEPFIDEKTMELHHDKHLQTYINNLNVALKDQPQLQKLSLEQLIRKSSCLPQPLQTTIRNNAGGVYNHRFFFAGLSNQGTKQPSGALAREIQRQFGGFDAFETAMKQAALSVFGSGYAWLVQQSGKLVIITTPNQNCPIEQGKVPILAIDVWEHAYYLKHYNGRADYIQDWFQIINWEQAERIFDASKGIRSITVCT